MKKLLTFGILLLCLGLGTAREPQAQSGSAPRAKVVDAFGTAQKQIGDKAAWQNINVGDLLPTQTTIKTGADSAVLLQLPDQHVFRIGAETVVVLKELGKDKAFSFNVLSGHVWSYVRRASKPTRYEVETPSAVVGVSGTVFSVFHDPNTGETSVSTEHGEVKVRQGNLPALAVREGFYTSLRPGQRSAAKALVQTEMHRKMWRALRQNEPWTRGNNTLRLNKSVETTYRPFIRPVAPGERLRVPQERRPGERPIGRP